MIENTLGYNIKANRRKHSLTQEQMARVLYMKRQTLSNYETGKRVPDIYDLIKIADLFDITLDELVGRNKP